MDMVNFNLMELSVSQLEELLNYHNNLYWKQNAPVISDASYDQIVRRLAQLDPNNPLITAIFTPEISDGQKVRHAVPMLSLDKAYSLEEVLSWAKKTCSF
jgi:DNA ligase (NAD+)